MRRSVAVLIVCLGFILTDMVIIKAARAASVSVGNMVAARDKPSTVTLPDGRVLVAGGRAGGWGTYAEIYNPANDRWQETGAEVSFDFTQTGATPLLLRMLDGRVLLAGANPRYGSGAALYDSSEKTWRSTTSPPVSPANGVALSGNRALVVGVGLGLYPTSSAVIYDADTDKWIFVARPPPVSELVSADANYTLLPSGRVMVMTAGANQAIYDPSTDTWSKVRPPVVGSAGTRYSVARTSTGDVLALSHDPNSAGSKAYRYEERADRWRYAGTTAADVNIRATRVGGGAIGVGPSLTSWAYDEANDLWSAGPTLLASTNNIVEDGTGGFLLLGRTPASTDVWHYQAPIPPHASAVSPVSAATAVLDAPAVVNAHPGSPATVVGRLLDADTGKPLAGEVVNIWSGTASGGWERAPSATTDAAGTVQFTASPLTTTWALRHPASDIATQAAADVHVVSSAARAPGAVSVIDGQSGSTSAQLQWGAPIDDGGSAVTGYRITGGPTVVQVPASTTARTITGLTNGRSYDFAVAAINARGVGPATSVTVTPSGSSSFSTDSGAQCGLLPPGVTTWRTSNSPIDICHAGLVIGPTSDLVLDASSGPIRINVRGASPISVAGELRTVGTDASRRIAFMPSATPWRGIQSGQASADGVGATVIRLANTDLGAGAVSVDNGGVHLDDVTTSRSGSGPPVIVARESTTTIDHSSFAGGGVSLACDVLCTTAVRDSIVARALGPGLSTDGPGRLDLHRITVTASGVSAVPKPSVSLGNFLARLGATGDVDGLVGGSNGLDAIALDGSVVGDLDWRSTYNDNATHELGYIAQTLTVAGGTMRIAHDQVVRTQKKIVVEGGRLEAAGPNVLMTSVADPGGPNPVCPSNLAVTCDSDARSWEGVTFAAARAAELVDVHLMLAKTALSGYVDTLAMQNATIEHSDTAVSMDSVQSAAIGSTVVRQCRKGIRIGLRVGGSAEVEDVALSAATAAGPLQPGEAFPGLEIRVGNPPTVVGAATASIQNTTIDGFQGTGLILAGLDDPQVHTVSLTNNLTAASILAKPFSIGAGGGIDAVIGSGNRSDVILLAGEVTRDIDWVSPHQNSSPAPLGYAVGSQPFETDVVPNTRHVGLELGTGVMMRLPADGVVKQHASVRLGKDSSLIADSGAVFTGFDDLSVAPAVRNYDPLPEGTADEAGIESGLTGPSSTLRLTDTRVQGSVGIDLSRNCGQIVLTNVKLIDGGVDSGRCNPIISGLTVDGAPGTGLRVGLPLPPTPDDAPLAMISDVTVTNSGFMKSDVAVALGGMSLALGASGSPTVMGANNKFNYVALSDVTIVDDAIWVSPRDTTTVQPLGYVAGTINVPKGRTLTLTRGTAMSVRTIDLIGGTLDARAGGIRINARADDVTLPAEPWMSTLRATVRIEPRNGVGGLAISDSNANARVEIVGAGLAPGSLQYTFTSERTDWGGLIASLGAPIRVHASALLDGLYLNNADGSEIDGSYLSLILAEYQEQNGDYTVADIFASDVTMTNSTIFAPSKVGLQLRGDTSGTFACLDVQGRGTALKVSRDTGGLPLTISDSDLATGLLRLDNQTAVTTERVWWGQPGGPAPGQVSNPGLLNDIDPGSAAGTCAGAPDVAVLPPAIVHASPRAVDEVLVTWTRPPAPVGHRILAIGVVSDDCSPVAEAARTFSGASVISTVHPAGADNVTCSYRIKVITGVGTAEATTKPVHLVHLWPLLTNLKYPGTIDNGNVGSYRVTATGPADANVVLTVNGGSNGYVRKIGVINESGLLDVTLDLRSLKDSTSLYFQYLITDSGGTRTQSVPVATLTKKTTATTAPQMVTSRGLNTYGAIWWAPPRTTGGRIVTSYRISLSPGNVTKTASARTKTVTFAGLHNNAAYTATVTPITSKGVLASASTTLMPRAGTDFGGYLRMYGISTGREYYAGSGSSVLGQPGDIASIMKSPNSTYEASLILWRPSTGNWYSPFGAPGGQWGQSGDVPVLDDYTGDGESDLAVWRPSDGTWRVRGQQPVAWGTTGDIPVPADYDGDGRADFAVYRPSTSTWHVYGKPAVAFGAPGDIPVPGDYNNDGREDFATYSRESALWFVQGGSLVNFGHPGDVPVPSAWDDDGVMRFGSYARGAVTLREAPGNFVKFDAAAANAHPVNLPYAIYQAFWNDDGTLK